MEEKQKEKLTQCQIGRVPVGIGLDIWTHVMIKRLLTLKKRSIGAVLTAILAELNINLALIPVPGRLSPPHFGHLQLTHSVILASGDSPSSVGSYSVTSGNTITLIIKINISISYQRAFTLN